MTNLDRHDSLPQEAYPHNLPNNYGLDRKVTVRVVDYNTYNIILEYPQIADIQNELLASYLAERFHLAYGPYVVTRSGTLLGERSSVDARFRSIEYYRDTRPDFTVDGVTARLGSKPYKVFDRIYIKGVRLGKLLQALQEACIKGIATTVVAASPALEKGLQYALKQRARIQPGGPSQLTSVLAWMPRLRQASNRDQPTPGAKLGRRRNIMWGSKDKDKGKMVDPDVLAASQTLAAQDEWQREIDRRRNAIVGARAVWPPSDDEEGSDYLDYRDYQVGDD